MRFIRKIFLQKILSSGFSIPELLITIAIVSIMTAVVLFKYPEFNSSILLSSQAYELALDFREAQTFSLGARTEGTDPSQFREEYGLYFNMSDSNQYIFFQDNGDINPAHYDPGEEVNVILLDSRYAISNICINNVDCTSTVSNIAVSFRRPDFDAKFYSTDSSTIDTVYVELTAVGSTNTRMVSITNTGQITVVD